MNLKVGWAPVRSESGGKFFLVVPLHISLALKVQLVVLVSAFVMVSIQFCQFLVCRSAAHGALRAQQL